jgi:hypothetical protein
MIAVPAAPIPILVLTLIDPSLLVGNPVAKATLTPAHEARMNVVEFVCVALKPPTWTTLVQADRALRSSRREPTLSGI